MPQPLRHFRFWCQSVLPLVYDDSLSYYEVLCKVVEYINNLIKTDAEIFNDIDKIKEELTVVQKWIENYDTSYIKEIVDEYITVGVYFGLTNDGHFVAYIPDSWDEITFTTSEYDDFTTLAPEFGHLILNY